MKDVLEDEVDEKFYLDQEKVDKLIINSDKSAIGYIPRTNGTQHQSNTVYKTDGESPSMQATDYKDPVKVLIKNATKKGYIEDHDGDGVDLAYPDSKTRRGRVQNGLSQTLDTEDSKGVVVEAKKEYGRMGRQAVETLNENDVKHSDTINPFNKRVSSKDGVSPTLTTRPEGFKTAVLPVVDNTNIKPINPLKDKTSNGWHFEQQVYDSNGITRTVKAGGGSGNIPKTFEYPKKTESTENAHFLIGGTQKNAGITNGDYTTALTSAMGAGGGHVPMHNLTSSLRIRKLTPKECWRLMGFSDDDFHKAEEVNSNTQLYKQAGNSIVVDVLEGIFKQLLEEQKNGTINRKSRKMVY